MLALLYITWWLLSEKHSHIIYLKIVPDINPILGSQHQPISSLWNLRLTAALLYSNIESWLRGSPHAQIPICLSSQYDINDFPLTDLWAPWKKTVSAYLHIASYSKELSQRSIVRGLLLMNSRIGINCWEALPLCCDLWLRCSLKRKSQQFKIKMDLRPVKTKDKRGFII